jgi:hypothetical protein
MQSETVWAMWPKGFLDFNYPEISLAFLDTFSAMEKVSEGKPRPSPFRHGGTPLPDQGGELFFWGEYYL